MSKSTNRDRSKVANLKLVLFAWHNHCYYCGMQLTRDTRSVDHIVNRGEGGITDSYFNLVVACNKCNNIKSRRKDNHGIDYLLAYLLHTEKITFERKELLDETLKLRLKFYGMYPKISLYEMKE